ncbi:991_t:CDS:2, partial [Scutellospora calospora]
ISLSKMSKVYENIPIIDFSQFKTNQQICAQQIKEACENLGFFYLKNHGISQETITEVFDIVKLYFEQPREEKLKFVMNGRLHGYASMRQENLDISRKVGDVKETFTVGDFNKDNEAITQTLPPFLKEKGNSIAPFYR